MCVNVKILFPPEQASPSCLDQCFLANISHFSHYSYEPMHTILYTLMCFTVILSVGFLPGSFDIVC